MSDTTYEYIDINGVIVPDTGSILGTVQTEYQGVFGDNIDVGSQTPFGLLIAAETLARSNVIQNNAAVANQINPNQAFGVFLDAICAMTGLERTADTYTTVPEVALAGVPETPIPTGALASTDAGDQFALISSITLDANGNGFGAFAAVAPGPIACGTGTLGLVNVVTDVLGWETVANSGTATIGGLAQSDQALRALRRQTLFLQGVALIGAILSAINDLENVIGSQGLENYTSSPETIDGVYLVANSVWVCVDGGTPQDIASALLENKSLGCAWNGAQSLAIIEPASGQTYTVQWDIPTLVPLLVSISVRQGTYQGNVVNDVTAAILAFAANAVPNVEGFAVGESASPFEIAAGVQATCQGIYVQNCLISLASTPDLQPAEIAMLLYQKATVIQDDITVTLLT